MRRLVQGVLEGPSPSRTGQPSLDLMSFLFVSSRCSRSPKELKGEALARSKLFSSPTTTIHPSSWPVWILLVFLFFILFRQLPSHSSLLSISTMKSSTLYVPAMALLHHGIAFASPGKNPVPAQDVMPNWSNMINGVHQVAMYTDGINSQQGALHAHVKNPANQRTTLLYTGGNRQLENAQHTHNYLQSIGADTSKIRHVAIEPHRGELSHEKHFITPEKSGLQLDSNFELHPSDQFKDQLLPNVPVNTLVMANTPTDQVIRNLEHSRKKGRSLGYVNHHLSGAMNRPTAEMQMNDIHHLGEAVRRQKGHLVWTDTQTSWDGQGSAMTEPTSKLRAVQPAHHVRFAQDSSTFMHDKAKAVDEIGRSVNENHVDAVRPGRFNNGQGLDYEGYFNNIRTGNRNDPEIKKDIKFIDRKWHSGAVQDLQTARFGASPDKLTAINKHLDHIEDKSKYIADVKKPGFNVEFIDAKNQAAFLEAAHNPEQDPSMGAYVVPVSHSIDENNQLKVNELSHVDPKQPIHWHVKNANSDRAMERTMTMMNRPY